MVELIIYAVLLLLVIAHLVMAIRMYMHVHNNPRLSQHERNSWKVKALVFPAYYWPRYKNIT